MPYLLAKRIPPSCPRPSFSTQVYAADAICAYVVDLFSIKKVNLPAQCHEKGLRRKEGHRCHARGRDRGVDREGQVLLAHAVGKICRQECSLKILGGLGPVVLQSFPVQTCEHLCVFSFGVYLDDLRLFRLGALPILKYDALDVLWLLGAEHTASSELHRHGMTM